MYRCVACQSRHGPKRLKLDPMQVWRRPWRWWSDEWACCDGSLVGMKAERRTLEFFWSHRPESAWNYGENADSHGDRWVPGCSGDRVQIGPGMSTRSFLFGREALVKSDRPFQSLLPPCTPKGSALVPDVARFKHPPLGQSEELTAAKGIDAGNGETTRDIWLWKRKMSKINTIDHVRQAVYEVQ